MAGLLGTLHSAGSGMRVSQTSIQTASHNINNMNTPGYSRQRVEQSAKSAYSNPGFNSSMGAGQLGTGAEATDIIRIRNTFYDFQYRSESHNYGDIGIKYEHYTTMETIFNEPSDSAISASLSNFFSSWQELSKNPSDTGAKDIVIQNSKYLANNISKIKEKLINLSEQAKRKLGDDIEEINGMFKELKSLNKNIKIVEGSEKTPNDLLDQRDRIIDDLSFKMDINNEDIRKALETGDASLKYNRDASLEYNGEILLTYKDIYGNKETVVLADKTDKKMSGELQGSLYMIDKIAEYQKSIDELAEGIAKGANNVINGKDVNADTKLDTDLFVFDKDKTPILKVNKDFSDDPKNLTIKSETAQEMYRLKGKKFEIAGEITTIDKFYSSIVQKLGNETQEVIRNEKNQGKILKDINNSRLNLSGVSLDEEMVNLIQFQHAYNASAKVISTIDSLLDVVVNGLKR